MGRLRSACPGSAVSSALLGELRSTRGCGDRASPPAGRQPMRERPHFPGRLSRCRCMASR
eukprot:6999569-Prymnesium_polylepis.2